MFGLFAVPAFVSLLALGAVFWYGGLAAFVTAAVLSVLEVTLSFDNAVVNAKVLKEMAPAWQKRFLTWGMLIAVFGTRLILPVLIVSATAWVSPFAIARFALFDPARYSALLSGAHVSINAFGAMFLLLVSLNYFFDEEKKLHWIGIIEKHLARWGEGRSLELFLALASLFLVSCFVPIASRGAMLAAGLFGVLLYFAMEFVVGYFSSGAKSARQGFILFIYLNILDSAFSLDSVVGAFALSFSIPVIVVGLGIGAYFVRTLTVYLVHHKTLDSLMYIEHGAYWAIFGLALSMFADLVIRVPEAVTGSVGLLFMLAAYYSSVQAKR